MFTTAEKIYLVTAIEQSMASQKRAEKATREPRLQAIYNQIYTDLLTLKHKVEAIETAGHSNKK